MYVILWHSLPLISTNPPQNSILGHNQCTVQLQYIFCFCSDCCITRLPYPPWFNPTILDVASTLWNSSLCKFFHLSVTSSHLVTWIPQNCGSRLTPTQKEVIFFNRLLISGLYEFSGNSVHWWNPKISSTATTASFHMVVLPKLLGFSLYIPHYHTIPHLLLSIRNRWNKSLHNAGPSLILYSHPIGDSFFNPKFHRHVHWTLLWARQIQPWFF
jgi:hypothetical protein